jgi:hypothetical protein
MDTSKSLYSGPDRRKRYVYVTQNHEYHCKDGVCVAVREPWTGALLRRHPVVGKRVTGALVLNGSGGIASISAPAEASPGQRIHFAIDAEDRGDVLTSSLKSVGRSPRDVVAQYETEEEMFPLMGHVPASPSS